MANNTQKIPYFKKLNKKVSFFHILLNTKNMKKYIIIPIISFIAIGIYFGTMGFQWAAAPVINHFQDDNLSVITLDNSAVGKTTAVTKLSSNLGINARLTNGGQDIDYQNDKDPSQYLITNSAKGRLSFSKSTQKYEGAYKPQLTDAKQAQTNAEQFLTANDLMPQNKAELKLIHAGGLRAASADDGGTIIDKMQTFTYGRVIDGVPVSGNGSRIIVNVGEKGEVLGVSKNWKEYNTTKKQKVEKTNLKSQTEAEAEFGKLVNFNFGKGVSPKVKSIQKMYFDGGGNVIQPAYFFETIVTVTDEKGNKTEQPFLGVVSMLKNSPEAINPDPAEVLKIAKSVRTAQENQNPNANRTDDRKGNENK